MLCVFLPFPFSYKESGVQALNRFMHLLYNGDVWLPNQVATECVRCGQYFRKAYGFLAAVSKERCELRFPLAPKLHSLEEIVFDLQVQLGNEWIYNCIVESCSLDEDFIGHCAFITRHVSPRRMALRTFQRYFTQIMLAWRIWWHCISIYLSIYIYMYIHIYIYKGNAIYIYIHIYIYIKQCYVVSSISKPSRKCRISCRISCVFGQKRKRFASQKKAQNVPWCGKNRSVVEITVLEFFFPWFWQNWSILALVLKFQRSWGFRCIYIYIYWNIMLVEWCFTVTPIFASEFYSKHVEPINKSFRMSATALDENDFMISILETHSASVFSCLIIVFFWLKSMESSTQFSHRLRSVPFAHRGDSLIHKKVRYVPSGFYKIWNITGTFMEFHFGILQHLLDSSLCSFVTVQHVGAHSTFG